MFEISGEFQKLQLIFKTIIHLIIVFLKIAVHCFIFFFNKIKVLWFLN